MTYLHILPRIVISVTSATVMVTVEVKVTYMPMANVTVMVMFMVTVVAMVKATVAPLLVPAGDFYVIAM